MRQVVSGGPSAWLLQEKVPASHAWIATKMASPVSWMSWSGRDHGHCPCRATHRTGPSVVAAAAATTEAYGGVDVCVANAGGASGGQDAIPFLDMEPEQWRAMIDRNLTTAFNTGLAFGRIMASAGGGSMIFVTSQLAEVVRPGLSHYAAGKGGVTQLMRGMALDLVDHGVRVNAIAPGPIRHERNAAWFDRKEVKEEMLRFLPIGRTGRPEELAGALLYLASDESTFTTGTTITVDGGYTLV